jgi:hypothetical protein
MLPFGLIAFEKPSRAECMDAFCFNVHNVNHSPLMKLLFPEVELCNVAAALSVHFRTSAGELSWI